MDRGGKLRRCTAGLNVIDKLISYRGVLTLTWHGGILVVERMTGLEFCTKRSSRCRVL